MRKLNPDYAREVCRITSECPYFRLQSMKLVEMEIGSCLVEISLEEKHLQPFGIVHGGVYSSIIDAATFWAVFPEVDEDQGMTTVDLKLNNLAPVRSGKLIAKGSRIKLGKTLGLGAAEVMDDTGRQIAYGISTLMVIPDLPVSKEGLPPKFL